MGKIFSAEEVHESNCNHCHGPGFSSPCEAIKGPREKVLYFPCVSLSIGKEDYIATVDVDPTSETYSKVINRCKTNNPNEELHHTGWNSCSSCFGDVNKKRRYLIAPALSSGNIYIFDTSNEREVKLHHVIDGEKIKKNFGLTWPHSSHCLGSGEIMISYMGGIDEQAKGGFLLINGDTFEPKELWSGELTPFGYDFWYQPRHDVMVSTEFGTPACFKNGFNPANVEKDYGKRLHFWSWSKRKLIKSIDLGNEGLIPLEVRFLHDPDKAHGFVGAALSSSVIHFYKDTDGEWQYEKVIQVEPKEVEGWALPAVPGLITDILVSLDDRFLYFSNWFHGDLRQYDISDPHHPKLVGQIFLGGSFRSDGPITLKNPSESRPIIPTINGTKLQGGPQMIQLSLDGKRLYVTNSLLSTWDKQFYPDLTEHGGQLLQVDVDTENGGLKLNTNFLVDLGKEPWGPVLGHEVRYPGGDCSSDIWL